MYYSTLYHSPLGEILLAGTEIHLTGLWFRDQKHFAAKLSPEHIYIEDSQNLPASLSQSIRWLDIYFSGKNPDFMPVTHLTGTSFQLKVWEILKTIPYGETMTYGEIASVISRQCGNVSMSAQAVGNAVGRNPISIIIPCHRVIGANGKLTGYAGGIERKQSLLTLEKRVVKF